jgi:hypothetical protein
MNKYWKLFNKFINPKTYLTPRLLMDFKLPKSLLMLTLKKNGVQVNQLHKASTSLLLN